MKTNNKKKIYWQFNWIMAAVVVVVLAIVFLCRYFGVGTPVEKTWTQEVLKYLVMLTIISVIVGTILYVPFQALSSKIAKERGGETESAAGDN